MKQIKILDYQNCCMFLIMGIYRIWILETVIAKRIRYIVGDYFFFAAVAM